MHHCIRVFAPLGGKKNLLLFLLLIYFLLFIYLPFRKRIKKGYALLLLDNPLMSSQYESKLINQNRSKIAVIINEAT